MINKKWFAVPMIGLIGLTTACSSGAVKDMPAMTLEEVAGKRLVQMTNDEKEGLIYQYVSDMVTVNPTNLLKIEGADEKAITSVLKRVNSNLEGNDNKALTEAYANYLLLEFARTPNKWEQADVKYVGFDASTRLYFVDVTYKTTGAKKKVIPSSKIPKGAPNEEVMKQTRLEDFTKYLEMQTMGKSDKASEYRKYFERVWGKEKDIREEQQGISLVDRSREDAKGSKGLGVMTYSGLVEDTKFNNAGEMTIRYVMKYKYNLGEETDLEVQSLYMKDYDLDYADELSVDTSATDTGIEVLKPFVDKTIQSYHKASEESNDIGLYSLFDDYSGVDKYYEDMSKYTVNQIGSAYTYKILKRDKSDLTVLVDRVNRIRAKGAEMSLPVYNEKLIYNMVLSDDDTIKIKSTQLLESKLVGEPLSVIKNVSGVSDLIQYSGNTFTKDNEKAVKKTLKDFTQVVFDRDIESEAFTSSVDIGVSQETLKKVSDVITGSPQAKRKVNYLVSWDTKTNVYVSVTLREIYQGDNNNLDTEAVVDLINRDGVWKVVNYTRTLSIKSAKAELQVEKKNMLSENK